MRLRLVENVRREQSKLDGLLANVCERSPTFSFIERRAGSGWFSVLNGGACVLDREGIYVVADAPFLIPLYRSIGKGLVQRF